MRHIQKLEITVLYVNSIEFQNTITIYGCGTINTVHVFAQGIPPATCSIFNTGSRLPCNVQKSPLYPKINVPMKPFVSRKWQKEAITINFYGNIF